MAPSRVSDADVLAIWRRIEAKRQRVLFATAKFRVGQHVLMSKEKMKFANVAEQNFQTETFRIVKVIDRPQRAVYELVDLNGTARNGQFCQEDLTPVRITSRATYKIDKILEKRVDVVFENISYADEGTFGTFTRGPLHLVGSISDMAPTSSFLRHSI